MKTVAFLKNTDMTQSIMVLKGFIKYIKLLMVTMELTSSDWKFAHR